MKYESSVTRGGYPKSRASDPFYKASAWKKLSKDVLTLYGEKCMTCNEIDGIILADHIKPRSLFPKLELDFNNLQVLCVACCVGRGDRYTTDHRPGNVKMWLEEQI